jgi:hypothetical protein
VYISCAYYLYISVDVLKFWLPSRISKRAELYLDIECVGGKVCGGRWQISCWLRPGFLDLLPSSSGMEKKKLTVLVQGSVERTKVRRDDRLREYD